MMLKKKNLQIAIDGPIGAGKSTLAFSLSRQLGLIYIYTGAMYRAAAWLALVNKISLTDEEKIISLLKSKKFELRNPSNQERYTDVYIKDKDITQHLFTVPVTQATTQVAKLAGLRQYLVALQQQMVVGKPVVLEGRDIGTVVLPHADLKIFLKANLEKRAFRRWQQLQQIKKPRPLDQVITEINQRDQEDSKRQASPLTPASDAWILDSTNLTNTQTVELVINKLREKGLIT